LSKSYGYPAHFSYAVCFALRYFISIVFTSILMMGLGLGFGLCAFMVGFIIIYCQCSSFFLLSISLTKEPLQKRGGSFEFDLFVLNYGKGIMVMLRVVVSPSLISTLTAWNVW